MADLVPLGINRTTGQLQQTEAGDVLTDIAGTGVGGSGAAPTTLDYATSSPLVIPANTLDTDEMAIDCTFWGTSGDGAGTTLTIALDGNTITSLNMAASNTVGGKVTVVRTGATSATSSAFIVGTEGGAEVAAGIDGATVTWANSNNLTFTWSGGMNETAVIHARVWPAP